MEQYIDKSAVVAEINDRRDKIKKGIFAIPLKGHERADAAFEYQILGKVRDFLDTFEVKEVDLEKELSILDNTLFDLDGVAVKGATHYLTVEDVKDIAKHFFELGLKTQKADI